MLLAILGILDGGEEAVIKNGRYSDGYYSNSSSIDTTYNSPNGTPEIAQDNSLYYVYASGLATVANNNTPIETSGVWYAYATGVRSLADGPYSNGYYNNDGTKSDTYNSATPVDTIDGEWYTYAVGVPSLGNGGYSNGYFVNGVATHNPTPYPAQDSMSYYFVFLDGTSSLANGSYTNGFYAYNGGLIPTPNGTPLEAIDNPGYYYVDGVTVSGAYSNGYYNNDGTKSTTYSSNNTPQQAQDGGWYIYTNGNPSSAANGVYSFGYFVNGTFTNNATPNEAIDNPSYYYVYLDNAASLADGAYSNGHYVAGVKSTTSYNTATPVDTIDGNWYTYIDGVPTLAQGAYTNGYYTNGVPENNSTPSEAQDNIGIWYVYNNGSASPAVGAYSNGYYASNGAIDHTYNSPDGFPQFAAQDDGLYYVYVSGAQHTPYHNLTPTETSGVWYTYDNGARSLANGAYTNGYYSNGTKSTTYDSATPVDTIDGDWYTYVDGVPTLAAGGYTDAYYQGGVPTGQATPYVTADGAPGIYYVYVNETSSLASGAYSNGYYNNDGTKSTSFDTITTSDPLIVAIDGGWYSYDAGVPTAAFEYLGYNNCADQTPTNQLRVFSASSTLTINTIVYCNTNPDGESWTNNITLLTGFSFKGSSFSYNNNFYGVGNDNRIGQIQACSY